MCSNLEQANSQTILLSTGNMLLLLCLHWRKTGDTMSPQFPLRAELWHRNVNATPACQQRKRPSQLWVAYQRSGRADVVRTRMPNAPSLHRQCAIGRPRVDGDRQCARVIQPLCWPVGGIYIFIPSAVTARRYGCHTFCFVIGSTLACCFTTPHSGTGGHGRDDGLACMYC